MSIATWYRTRKGGTRPTDAIRCRIVGSTPSGNYVIEYLRGYRTVRETVSAKNVKRYGGN